MPMSPKGGFDWGEEDNVSNSSFIRNTELELMRLNQKYSELEKKMGDEIILLHT